MALGRFGHSVTSLGDLNNDGCDGQHLPVVMMCVQWWIVLQILLLVLHLIKEEKCSFTMGLKRLESTPLCSRQVCGGSEVVLTVCSLFTQTITAEQMTNQVTNLTSSGGITGFGFSLDGKVDVDDNQYRGDTTLSEMIEQLFKLHTHRFGSHQHQPSHPD